MRTLAIALGLMWVAAGAVAATTYRWVDADGLHYSDQPHPGAEKIVLGEIQTYSSPGAPEVVMPSERKAQARQADFHYDSCAVVQPATDQVFFDVESITVTVQVQPAMRTDDKVVLSFDGQQREPTSMDQSEFRITPIDRGTHTAAATVRDSRGKPLCQSTAITFHVRQHSMLAPLAPPRVQHH
jgi:hypothetical protein